MRQFALGLATGLVISTFLRTVKSQKRNQERIALYYQRRASSYQATDQAVSLAGFAPRIQMRLQLLDQMQLRPGDHVLDVACGTGSNFEYIMERIGPTGRLVGTDFSQPMLDQAQIMVDERGWQNVKLIQSDAATLTLDEMFDAVLCTLGLVVIPNHEQAMERMWEHLKPGGVFGMSDLCESQRWYMQPLNFLMDVTDATLITDTSRRPWEWLEARADNYEWQDLALGYMYTAVGYKPV